MEPSSAGPRRPALLCIAPSFAPETTPTAIRAGKLLDRLRRDWDIEVLTASEGTEPKDGLRVERVSERRPRRLLAALTKLRLNKLIELFVWPDGSIFWVRPAIRAGRRAIAARRPDAIVVFMMPYGGGLAGLALSRRAKIPLLVNLDDSPTCTDMHPHFPSRLHHRLAVWLEDRYIRRAAAVIYVSERNLVRVRERQPPAERSKLHLVRYGADAESAAVQGEPPAGDRFEIVYTGSMTGWWSLLAGDAPQGLGERAFGAWTRLGRHELIELDHRTSSPAVIGRAILDVIARHPDWQGRVHLTIRGNPYPEQLVRRALERTGVQDVVTVFGPVPHTEVLAASAAADLLFLTLPARTQGSPGGRISAKTYEYLATDRPILAAAPAGENRDYLQGRAGVWLADPADERAMAGAIEELAAAKFAGAPRSFDRSDLRQELSYDNRAREFDAVLRDAAARGAQTSSS
jgi:glycosyltransferase involved in cell wall biosynthesis